MTSETKPSHDQNTQTNAVENKGGFYPLTFNNIANKLLIKAEDKLTKHELEELAEMSESANTQLAVLASVADNFGCLLGRNTGSSISMDERGVADLLFSFSYQIDAARAMQNLADVAKMILKDRN